MMSRLEICFFVSHYEGKKSGLLILSSGNICDVSDSPFNEGKVITFQGSSVIQYLLMPLVEKRKKMIV